MLTLFAAALPFAGLTHDKWNDNGATNRKQNDETVTPSLIKTPPPSPPPPSLPPANVSKSPHSSDEDEEK